MTEQASHCRNCGESLAGPYCSHCGQREGRGDLTFGEVAGEVLEEFFSWDSRVWRTLVPLVFRPGFLTAEFIAGRRARYVPPFRLYLIISFVLFLFVSLIARDNITLDADGTDAAAVQHDQGGEPGRALEEQEGSSKIGFELRPSSADELEETGEVVIAPIVIGNSEGDSSVGVDLGISLAEEDSAQWLKDLDKRLDENAEKLEDDPGAFLDLLFEYLPQMMFLLLPLFALLLKCCYLFSPFHYLQHLVFALHFHSFAYILYLAGELIESWLYANGIGGPLALVFVLYLPLALRRTYGSSLAGAVGKSLVIVLLDAVLLLFGFIFVVLLALALL